MPKFAEYFADVKDGKILQLCDATPSHELQEGQIMLTREEYQLLYGCRFARSDLDKIQKVLNQIKDKISEAGNDTSE